MPVGSIKELRDQIKAKRPDWDDEKIDSAVRSIYNKNPGIVGHETAPGIDVSGNPEANKKIQTMLPGESMMLNSNEETPAPSPAPGGPSMLNRLQSGIQNIVAPPAQGSDLPDQAKLQALQQMQNQQQGPISMDEEKQRQLMNSFKSVK